MPEPLTSELLRELLPKLVLAFPRGTAKGNLGSLADLYRTGLQGLTGDAVRFAVNRSIQEDTYFPKVARLRELATDWSRRNVYAPESVRTSRWDTCPVCGAVAKPRTIERIKRDPMNRYAPVLDEAGEAIWETVPSHGLFMDHDPRAHHVHEERD